MDHASRWGRSVAHWLAATALAAMALPVPAGDKALRYAFNVAETGFDPAQVSDLYSSNLIDNVFDTPLKYDYLARPVKLLPNTLAAMPEVAEGGTVYTMRVKPGIFFADDPAFGGRRRELVAEDYVYSIKRLFDPKLRSPNLYQLEGNIAGMDEVLAQARRASRMDYDTPVEGLRALDRYTFRVQLKQPNYNFIYYLAYCNITCAVAREVAETYGDKIAEHPVGTGPFRLAFWKRSSRMVFERNPDFREEYYDGEPAPDDGGPRRGLDHRRAAAALARVPQRRARPRRAPAERVREHRGAERAARAEPGEDGHVPRPHAGHGAHLLLFRDGGSRRGRLHAPQDRAAPCHHHGQRRRRGDPHRPQEPGDPGLFADRP